MEMIRKYLKNKYQIGGYQIAQIEYLLKTMFSELSKMIVIGFLLHDRLTLYLCAAPQEGCISIHTSAAWPARSSIYGWR